MNPTSIMEILYLLLALRYPRVCLWMDKFLLGESVDRSVGWGRGVSREVSEVRSWKRESTTGWYWYWISFELAMLNQL